MRCTHCYLDKETRVNAESRHEWTILHTLNLPPHSSPQFYSPSFLTCFFFFLLRKAKICGLPESSCLWVQPMIGNYGHHRAEGSGLWSFPRPFGREWEKILSDSSTEGHLSSLAALSYNYICSLIWGNSPSLSSFRWGGNYFFNS